MFCNSLLFYMKHTNLIHKSVMKTFPCIFMPTNCNFLNRTIKRFIVYSIYIIHISFYTSLTPAKFSNVTFSFTIISCTNRKTLIFGMVNSSTLFTRSILFSPVKILFIYWSNMFPKLSNTFSNYLILTHLK